MTKSMLYSVFIGIVLFPILAIVTLFFVFSIAFSNFTIFIISINWLYYLAIIYILIGIVGIYNVLIRQPNRFTMNDNISTSRVTVGMTAYNDEGVVKHAVKDFLAHKKVDEVIVVDNNCTDNTIPEARQAGAKIVKEPIQGYGAAATRALIACLKVAKPKNNLVLIVEGDQTYVGKDIDKFLAFIGNADMVVGTRTTREITTPDSQISTLMQYGNVFIAKFLQLKYWDSLRLTDVGCTMRIIRPDVLEKILPKLTEKGNTFSPHMIDVVLKNGFKVVEIPVHFKKRGGVSKGIGDDFLKGLPYGLQMIWHILIE